MILLLGAATLQGCALFVSHYDAGAYQQFTSLKAFHLKLLEDNKETDGKSFDETKMKNACDAGELKFLEATEYAAGKKDETRVKALNYLHNVFSNDCKLGGKKLFGAKYVDEQAGEIKKNYDLAIQGEASRVGAPAK
jgi:hypothetical protein